MTADHVSVE